ncbi:trigger factor [Crocinitomix algicola]|uniref:trigger factor n=1 Tax=Crocinitomix algicola TaxID=1740263 RepID=UPI000829ABF2|nr:trigger factor [Crocinitomix algicola]
MNVVEEKIDDLNAILRVQITPDDYAESVNKAMNTYRKQANIPGFRPGKIPLSLIKKKFGKSILAEELNSVVNKSLNDFIQSNNLNILGNPLPKYDEEVKGDFNNPENFEFVYEIGMAPEFEISLSKKNKFDYLKVEISDEMLDKEVENLARRYGSLVAGEEVGEKDMILGEFSQVDGDIKNTSTISVEFISDDKIKADFIGKKVGAEFTLDPRKVSKGDDDLASMLAISKEEAAALEGDFNFTITEIKTMVPAAVDQALFDKIFGEGNVKSEEELRTKISTDLERMFGNDSDRLFSQKISDALIEKTSFELPDEFLKRWIMASNEKEITQEELDKDYDNYKKSLKWQLIQNKLIKDNDIKVEHNEVMEYTKGLLANQFAQYGMPAPEDKELEDQAKSVLQNKDEANKIYDNLYGTKMLNFFKETVKLNEKSMQYDDFIKEAYAQN